AVRWRRKRLPESPWFYRALVVAGPLSVVALICGWVTTEVGRQPWVVYRVMRTSEAVTGAGGIPVGYAALALVYIGLALAVAWIPSTLSIPLFIAAVGIIFRGTAYALRAGVATARELRAIDTVFALSSILTPFALGAAVGGIASRRVPVGNAAGDQFSSWL